LPVKGEPWQLWIGGRKITSDIAKQIYSAVHNQNGLQYWLTKPDVSQEVVEAVDWKAVGRSMKSVPRGRRVFVTKHTAGMCGVGKFMRQWKQWEKDQCPRCGMPEDAAHVWTCKDAGAQEVWSKSLASVELSLRKWNMDPTVLHVIITYLKSWHTGETVSYQPPCYLEAVLKEQCTIGWHRFYVGWLSPQWEIIQQNYYNVTRSNKTGKRWVSALIQKLWDMAWDLWEHRKGVLH